MGNLLGQTWTPLTIELTTDKKCTAYQDIKLITAQQSSVIVVQFELWVCNAHALLHPPDPPWRPKPTSPHPPFTTFYLHPHQSPIEHRQFTPISLPFPIPLRSSPRTMRARRANTRLVGATRRDDFPCAGAAHEDGTADVGGCAFSVVFCARQGVRGGVGGGHRGGERGEEEGHDWEGELHGCLVDWCVDGVQGAWCVVEVVCCEGSRCVRGGW
jgi:hypothetical protein